MLRKARSPAAPGQLRPGSSSAARPPLEPDSVWSRWLMLWYLAGYPVMKIRRLFELSKGFPIDNPLYTTSNIETTFKRLQHNGRLKESGDAYMAIVMAIEDVFGFRRQALLQLEREWPGIAAEMTGVDENKEMDLWKERWTEEIRLLRHETAFSDFREKGKKFEHQLGPYLDHDLNDKESRGLRAKLRLRTSSTDSRRPRSRGESTANLFKQWGDDIKVVDIERPRSPAGNLRLVTRFGNAMTGRGRSQSGAKSADGSRTPGSAQHLDPLGFFSARPRTPSPLGPPEESGSKTA